MSVNRENVIWQNKQGQWSMAMYACEYAGDPSQDGFDEEWDVYYLDHFDWVSTGHPTPEAAFNSWRGANPGGHTEVPYKGNETQCAAYDQKVADFRAREAAERQAQAASPFRW